MKIYYRDAEITRNTNKILKHPDDYEEKNILLRPNRNLSMYYSSIKVNRIDHRAYVFGADKTFLRIYDENEYKVIDMIPCLEHTPPAIPRSRETIQPDGTCTHSLSCPLCGKKTEEHLTYEDALAEWNGLNECHYGSNKR